MTEIKVRWKTVVEREFESVFDLEDDFPPLPGLPEFTAAASSGQGGNLAGTQAGTAYAHLFDELAEDGGFLADEEVYQTPDDENPVSRVIVTICKTGT
jgi:hypothetical protein